MEELAQGWPTLRHQVWRISEQESTIEEIEMVLEEPLALHINGHQVAVLMRLPGMEKELAAGFCLSEGLVNSFHDVLTIQHCGRSLPRADDGSEGDAAESRNRVDVRVRPGALNPEARLDVVRLIRAGCGSVDVDRGSACLQPVESDLRVHARTIIALPRSMAQAQQVHQHAGGVHGAALYDPHGQVVVLCEDVGRHNAVDKAFGHCLLRDIPVRDKILFCSGRLSYEMVSKAVRLGLPVLASVSAPTALAVQLAERFGLTVIGYVRGGRMTVYTHPQRIMHSQHQGEMVTCSNT